MYSIIACLTIKAWLIKFIKELEPVKFSKLLQENMACILILTHGSISSHTMKSWSRVYNHFLLLLKILIILDGQGITHISFVDLSSLRESTLLFWWYQKRWIHCKSKDIRLNKNLKSYPNPYRCKRPASIWAY